jgi:hypothetical protein
MRFYHRVAGVAAVCLLSTAAWAQGSYVPPEQDVDDDYYAQQQQQQQAAYPQYGYMGVHPVPYEAGNGFCYQSNAHFHAYAPFDQYLFRERGGWFYFVGDPGDFGYSYQMWGYRGHHPISAMYGGGYCFIDWPHRHNYAPPQSLAFNFVGGYYVYAGPWDPWYWQWRPRYVSYYGDYYRRSYYGGIYWRVRPPPVYAPRITVGAPGVYRAGATVVAPGGGRVTVVAPPAPHIRGGVVVGAPAPRVGGSVVVGAPAPRAGVVVGAPAPPAPHVVAPPPPRAGVVVGAPAPPPHAGGSVYVGAPAPRAGVAVGAPPPRPAGGVVVGAPPAAHAPAPGPRVVPAPPRHH